MTEIGPILEGLRLGEYHSSFVEAGFGTWDVLLDIQESDLEALRVKLGHRRVRGDPLFTTSSLIPTQKLQRAIAQHRGSTDAQRVSVTERDLPKTSSQQSVSGPQSAAGCRGVKRRYCRHPAPDQHAPKKPATAYVLFANGVRKEAAKLHLSFAELAQMTGRKWQQVDPTERASYEARAATDKAEYKRLFEAYQKTDRYKLYVEYLADFRRKHTRREVLKDGSEAERAHDHTGAHSQIDQHDESDAEQPILSRSYGLPGSRLTSSLTGRSTVSSEIGVSMLNSTSCSGQSVPTPLLPRLPERDGHQTSRPTQQPSTDSTEFGTDADHSPLPAQPIPQDVMEHGAPRPADLLTHTTSYDPRGGNRHALSSDFAGSCRSYAGCTVHPLRQQKAGVIDVPQFEKPNRTSSIAAGFEAGILPAPTLASDSFARTRSQNAP